ncbi:MAG: transcription antitermination factor NusB [Bacteroidetes bacterium]|nr:transcription antitermination factor NusB [Bacteroidota bacterium]
MYKDEEDDRLFVRTLFNKTIINNEEYESAISERTKNWEVDRIALMDILILKMALSELVNFPGIPVKVSINEYIDISKEYSTPKSKQFVNGVIDKLALDYKEQGKIVKTGRGLIG